MLFRGPSLVRWMVCTLLLLALFLGSPVSSAPTDVPYVAVEFDNGTAQDGDNVFENTVDKIVDSDLDTFYSMRAKRTDHRYSEAVLDVSAKVFADFGAVDTKAVRIKFALQIEGDDTTQNWMTYSVSLCDAVGCDTPNFDVLETGENVSDGKLKVGKEYTERTKDIEYERSRPLRLVKLDVYGHGEESGKVDNEVEIKIWIFEVLPLTMPLTTGCPEASTTLPNQGNHVVFAGIDTEDEHDWHVVAPAASGRMLLALENTEIATDQDYDYEVWSQDCSTLVASSRHHGDGRGERMLINIQHDDTYRSHVYGRTPDDFEPGTTLSDYYEAIHIGNINGILEIVGTPTTKHTPPQVPGDPAGGTLEIAATFRNISTGAKARELRSLTFELDRLTNNNEFVSGRTGTGAFAPTDPPVGGGSVMYAVQNWDLPAETMQFIPGLDPNESVDLTFRIALANLNSFDFAVNVFAIPFIPGSAVVPAAADAVDAADFTGPSFTFNITEEMLRATSSAPLYLPFLQH
jgi:hypothetical protein